MSEDLAIDLCCGLGGWTEGFLAEGYEVIGFDIERHDYGTGGYPGQLVLQDILTLSGYQFKAIADCLRVIVASPPCQKYSYMAMPWKRAKTLAAWYREDPSRQVGLNALFNACFRIQREASEACGRHIPLIVENVRGAQPWVGRSAWNFGSYHLWGDVPALMPIVNRRAILKPQEYQRRHGTGSWFAIDMKSARAGITDPKDISRKVPGLDWSAFGKPGYKAQGFNVTAAQRYREGEKGIPHRTAGHWTNPAEHENGTKVPLSGRAWYAQGLGKVSSKSDSRKAASAQIAKIPFPLAQHIARTFKLPLTAGA